MVLYPHGPIGFVDDGLFVVEGRWKRSRFERKMTVFLLATGEVAVHSAIAMDEAGMAALEAIGRPSWILVPNSLHYSDAGWYGDRYPSARVLVPAAARAKLFEKVRRIDGSLDEDWPEALRGELAVVPLAGTRIGEVAFVHGPSRTLVLTDAAFHYKNHDLPWLARAFMHANGAYDRFGPSRIFTSFVVGDRGALRASIEALLEHEFDRVIVSHGRVLETGGKDAMRAAFAWLER
jgi:glyoxylase-like metal-dependent hydrolase (beta-lactamase superfamily II)